MAQAYFLNTITNVLGLLSKQREVLLDDGYDTISTIIHWKYDNMCEWCTTKSKLKTTIVGASYGEQKIKYIQVFSWWATNLILRGKQIVLADFDTTIMADCIYEAKLEYEYGKNYPYINKPEKFSHSN